MKLDNLNFWLCRSKETPARQLAYRLWDRGTLVRVKHQTTLWNGISMTHKCQVYTQPGSFLLIAMQRSDYNVTHFYPVFGMINRQSESER